MRSTYKKSGADSQQPTPIDGHLAPQHHTSLLLPIKSEELKADIKSCIHEVKEHLNMCTTNTYFI